MATPQLSPSSNVTLIYLTFKLKDKKTGIFYSGSVPIGTKNSSRIYSDDLIKREIRRWITSVKFTHPLASKMIVKWEEPEDQQYIYKSFDEQHIILYLPRVLGVPFQEICSAELEMQECDILLCVQPKNAIEIS